jgi:hypothetical protein
VTNFVIPQIAVIDVPARFAGLAGSGPEGQAAEGEAEYEQGTGK